MVWVAAGAPDVEVADVDVVLGKAEVEVVVPLALPRYESYEEEWAVERLAPKKSKLSCSVKSEAGSAGSTGGVSEFQTYAMSWKLVVSPEPREPPSHTVQF